MAGTENSSDKKKNIIAIILSAVTAATLIIMLVMMVINSFSDARGACWFRYSVDPSGSITLECTSSA